MSEIAPEISQLASILQQNGDKVLNAMSKLSLNAVLLQKLNKEFQFVTETGTVSESSFQVITNSHGNSQILKDLQFLHDFIQKTVGLKLTNSSSFSLLEDKIDISFFKNIRYLEIKKIPIKEVVGLKNVQSKLESIVCIRSLSKLEELLANCGGDNSSGFVWSELREAVLSFNNIKVLDTSVAFAPWLQMLDLSHNQITDVKAIECLPNLKYVNLGFNCLDIVPTFNRSARKKIQVLVLRNNYIENLSGLNGLFNLSELDLSNNLVSTCDGLNPLFSMSNLQWLYLEGNPISCHCNYRRSVVGYLHISASFNDFYLDKIKLSKLEKSNVGIKLSANNSLSEKYDLKEIVTASTKARSLSEGNNVNDQVPIVRRSRSGKARLVVIPNLDDGTYEEAPIDLNNTDFMTSSTEHLITKKRIENTRSTFGIDNWLVQGSSVVQDILGLPPVETPNSLHNACLEVALESVENLLTTTAVIERPPKNQPESCEKDIEDTNASYNEEEKTSNYFSVETSPTNLETGNSTNEELTLSKEVSPDIEEIEEIEESEEGGLDDNEKLFAVSKESKGLNNEIKNEELFLTINNNELYEREPIKRKIITKWSLSSIESCVKLKPNQLQFVFDTIRRDKRERTYTLELQEANILFKQIAVILESRTLDDMNQVVYKCVKCSSEFSVEKKTAETDQNLGCHFCNSKLILQLDEAPLPSYRENKNINDQNIKNTELKSPGMGGVFQTVTDQNEDKLIKCTSQSSIGSAASLDALNELPNIQNTSVKRSDSDIEVLSNPSQSSIEVLDGPGRVHNGCTPRRKRSSEERQYPAPVSVAVTNSVGNNSAGLTESSSSGSITDSICTAYENSSIDASGIHKFENIKGLIEKLKEKNEEPILQGILKNASIEISNFKQTDPVTYSYSDFSNIDHRIKLFLYTHVFDDTSEEFSFGLRAEIICFKSDDCFPSCVVASNKKLYFLKIIDSEQGDDANKFLQKIDSLCFSLTTIKCIYTLTWYQGFGVKIQLSNNKWKEYLILLKDACRTQNFLKFLISSELCSTSQIKIISEPLERCNLSVQHLLLSSTHLEDSSVQYFCLFNSFFASNEKDSKEIHSGGILTNSTELIIFTGKVHWLFDDINQSPPAPEYQQKFRNLMQVYKYNSTVILQFYDGMKEKEVWKVVMESKEVIESLIHSIKDSWEKLFSVPLKVYMF